jgi:glyceraldehyde-3-phosphate dehydrogenase (ferredoxin)
MTYPIIQREMTVHLNNGNWYARPIDEPGILGPVDYGWHRHNLYPDSFTFGEGLLAGSSIPGSRRLVLSAWSPQWDGFYVSSIGGAAYVFHGVGVNYIALRNRAETPSVLLLNHRNGEIQCRIEPVDVDTLWVGYADPEGERLTGFFALQQALFDRYAPEYPADKVRILAVGPAARRTKEGAIGSNPVRKGALTAVTDWAGRGGLGSRLLQYHNLAAIVFGGEWEDPDMRDSSEIDAYFIEHFGKKTIQTDLAATEKYRYVPQFDTGGTFGVNMRELNERILSFNYASIYAGEDSRLKQHQHFILDHYLAQFNEETIKPRKFQHCGEPCAVVCKKMNGRYKKDYEPYHALGPQCGVFDQRAAELLNDFIDAMGFDAIQAGGTLAWILELVSQGLLPPEDFGFPPREELRFAYADDPAQFDVVADSLKNAEYAMQVTAQILTDPRCAVFRQGMRSASRDLDKKYNIRSRDRAVYLAHGESGYMAPNQYWVPGMLSPMPMMGKYFVYYGVDFLPPFELGRKNVERMTYELFNENSGICRFHRKWSELITDEILSAHYDLAIDYKAHQFDLSKEVFTREGPKAVPWESERVIDLVFGYLEQWEKDGLKDPALDEWLARFRADKFAAAQAYWREIRRGIEAGFAAGADAIPAQLTPGQQANHKKD